MAPVLSISVDLDEIECYAAIHGLAPSEETRSRAVWTHAVPRFLDFFARLGLKATFFVVGSSLDGETGQPGLHAMAGAGHEIANHTFHHFYDLLRRGQAQRRDEIVRTAEVIERITGRAPKGFRAPGYNVDNDLLALLGELGYLYDSSVFPCATYYAAKLSAVTAMRLRGRTSRSLMGPKEVLLAPREPYPVGSSFWRRRSGRAASTLGGGRLMELPVAVLPGLQLPFIGTTLALAGPRGATAMAQAMKRRRFIGLELHGIDLLDARDSDLGWLAGHQPDLPLPWERKMEAYEAAITTLLRGGATAMTSCQAARHFAQT